jgi:hypothetical protein
LGFIPGIHGDILTILLLTIGGLITEIILDIIPTGIILATSTHIEGILIKGHLIGDLFTGEQEIRVGWLLDLATADC